MAIGKWNPFSPTASPAQSPPAPTALVKAAPVRLVTADGKQFGLENFGNTCYANSVLQALYFCGPFRQSVIQAVDAVFNDDPSSYQPSPARPRMNRGMSTDAASPQPASRPLPAAAVSLPPTLFSALRSLFLFISDNPNDKGTVAPRVFIEKLREVNELFRSTMHQDAHEFLNFLLNKVVDELEAERKRIGRRNPSPPPASSASDHSSDTYGSTLVHRLFEGVLSSETKCLTCETVSSRDESFLDLSIDIEQNSSITACLRQFSASEMLYQKNKFFCDSCCDLQEAEKRMKIKRLPNVLALHLKRFKYQEDVGKHVKLAYRVAFPFQLRLFNTVDDAQDPDRLYELFAIVVHIGSGPHHGHYIAIVKTGGDWHVFDDDSVDTIKESDISKYFGDSNAGSAYVLYYQAADIDLPSLGLKDVVPVAANGVQVPSEKVAEETIDTRNAPMLAPSCDAPAILTEDDRTSSTSGSNHQQPIAPMNAASEPPHSAHGQLPPVPPRSKSRPRPLPQRPHSSGYPVAGTSTPLSSTPVPPVPPIPLTPSSPALVRPLTADRGPVTPVSAGATSNRASPVSDASPRLAQPSITAPPSSFTPMPTPGSPILAPKRASRKLSFSSLGTSLGFGKRKDKDKVAERDRAQEAALTQSLPNSTISKSGRY